MSPRVIAGRARGRRLKSVPGDATRPILDRVKENLFNILGATVRGTRWLDLFAGTGQVGIEALSRGAEHCLFLELSRPALQVIQENLAITGLADQATVRRADAFGYLRTSPPEQQFDFIFIAPPQYKGMWKQALELIDERPGWLIPDGVAIVQIDPREYEALELHHFALYDERKYGKTLLLFYERPGE